MGARRGASPKRGDGGPWTTRSDDYADATERNGRPEDLTTRRQVPAWAYENRKRYRPEHDGMVFDHTMAVHVLTATMAVAGVLLQ